MPTRPEVLEVNAEEAAFDARGQHAGGRLPAVQLLARKVTDLETRMEVIKARLAQEEAKAALETEEGKKAMSDAGLIHLVELYGKYRKQMDNSSDIASKSHNSGLAPLT